MELSVLLLILGPVMEGSCIGLRQLTADAYGGADGVAQAAGLLLFFYTMWRGIRPLSSAAREPTGERF